jgi:uncharacterized membrane protein YfcA
MEQFLVFIRYSWYRKKRFAIPICLLAIMIIVAAIIGSVLGSRAAAKLPGMLRRKILL